MRDATPTKRGVRRGRCYRCGAPSWDNSHPCTACHAKMSIAWREGMTLQPTKEFPGVDIDAIHYDRRYCKKMPRAA